MAKNDENKISAHFSKTGYPYVSVRHEYIENSEGYYVKFIIDKGKHVYNGKVYTVGNLKQEKIL